MSIVKPNPFDDYFLQTAFYYFATKLEPHLLMVNEDSYKIYTKENCPQLQEDNLKVPDRVPIEQILYQLGLEPFPEDAIQFLPNL